jgi:hypothetical protein
MTKYLNNACLNANKQGLFCAPAKVKISNKLFYSAIDLLESLEVDDFDNDTVQLYGFVLHALNNKKVSLDLRNSCHNVIKTDIDNLNNGCFICTCHTCDDVPC